MTATQTRIRRDTLTNLNLATPADGELAYNTTDDRLHVGNGTLAGAIPHLNCYDDMKSYFNYATTTGSANAYVVTLPYAPASYTTGMRIKFKASFSCTGSSTINVNSLGAKTVKKVLSGALTALSSGDIISGVCYEAIYDGTDFQIFGVTPSLQTPGVVLLGTATASASAALDFESLITSSYGSYEFILKNLRPATDATELYLRTSTDNGVSYSAGASDYANYMELSEIDATPSTAEYASATDSGILLLGNAGNAGNAASESISGRVLLVNPLGTSSYKAFIWELMFINSTGIPVFARGSGVRNSTSDIDAVRFLMSSGNITSGAIDLYGRTI